MRKQSNISKKQAPLTWETFEDYILTEGLSRYKQALDKVDEATYLKLYPTLLEFIKPKIKRVDTTEKKEEAVEIKVLWDQKEGYNE
jgi:hypothetical protein